MDCSPGLKQIKKIEKKIFEYIIPEGFGVETTLHEEKSEDIKCGSSRIEGM